MSNKYINNKCIGPCYEKNVQSVHPLNYQKIKDDKPYCSIIPVKHYDNKKKQFKRKFKEKCDKPTEKKFENKHLLTSITYFKINEFLEYYYNIKSFEDCLNWLESYDGLILAKIRIFNLSFELFNDEINLIDYKLSDFFKQYLNYKINNIYSNIHKYIGIEDNNILIMEEKKNNLDIEELKENRINYIIKSFFIHEEINKFLYKYINNVEKDKKYFNLDYFLDTYIKYIIKKIKTILEK